MKRLWARIGMSIPCTDEEYEELKLLMETDVDKAQDLLWKMVYKTSYYDGESYLPPDADDNPNHEDFEF